MSAHKSLSGAGKAHGNADGDENAAETHEQTGCGSQSNIHPFDRETRVVGERDKEKRKDKELNDGSIKSLFDTIIRGFELANKEMLCGDNSGTAQATNDSENTVESLAATTASLKFSLCLNLSTVATGSGTNADDGSNHENDTNQMEPADFLTKAKVESNDVDETGEGEKS